MLKSQSLQFRKPTFTDVIPKEGIKLKDIRFTQDNPDEKVKWVLDAEKARFTMDGQFVSFMDFRIKLEPEDNPSIYLKGKRGSYDKRSGEINLHENLEGRTDNGYTIWTEYVLYNHEKGFLKTEEPVKLTGPFFSVESQGFYFNLLEEKLVFNKHVTALINKKALTL